MASRARLGLSQWGPESLDIARSQADTGRAAGSATAVWAASESRERTILFSDVKVTHRNESLLGLGRCGWRLALGLSFAVGQILQGQTTSTVIFFASASVSFLEVTHGRS